MPTLVNVLVVDDDEDDFILARDLIDEIVACEYRVRWVPSYEEALQALLATECDICLLDYHLGARTGIDLLREVRSLGCEVPIVFLTGQAEFELDMAAMHAGADDFLVKGQFTPRELERAIRYALERANTAAAQRRLTEELRLMQMQAQRSSQAKSTFLASMSHEFRTPLNAILGYSEMLIDQLQAGEAGDVADDVRRIKQAGTHLLMLVTDILDLSRIESGRLSLAPQEFDLSLLLQEVVAAVVPLVRRNNNDFTDQLQPTLGTIVADPTRVRQILFNILSNAAKFTRQGQVWLTVNRRPARHSDFLRHAGDDEIPGVDCIECIVKDTGIGMTPQQMERLFEPFSQVDDSGGRRFGGSGLGLAISRRLARMMGGEMWAESESGRGSTFRLTLPSDVTQAAQWRGPQQGQLDVDRRGAQVLALGVGETFARQVRDHLADVEVEFIAESGRRRGVKLARALVPAVIVVEVNLGDPRSLAVLGHLAGEPTLADVRFVVFLVDELGQFGCLLPAHGVLCSPLQGPRLQRFLAAFAGEGELGVHVWSNNATLLHTARELLGHTCTLVNSTLGLAHAVELCLVDLAGTGALLGWQAPGENGAARLLVAPHDARDIPSSFAAEMRAIIEQSGMGREALVRAVATAIAAHVAS